MGAVAKRPDDGPATRAPAKKKAAAKKAPAKKAAAKKAVAKKAPAKKTPAKKTAAKKAAKKSPPAQGARKSSTSSGPSMGLPELPPAPTDPLEILGLRQPLTTSTLKRAWREYAARHHPDQGGDPATFARGRSAFETLRDQVEAS